MNLKRLHSIFGGRGRLSRSDIETYAKTQDPQVKNSIEQRSMESAFDQDAMDGWEHANFDTSAMASLDKTYLPKSSIGWYVLGGTTLIGVIIVLLSFGDFTSQDSGSVPVASLTSDSVVTALLEGQEITLDESDVLLPAPIEQMENAPEQNQVKVAVIKNDFQGMNEIRVEDPSIPIVELPILDINIDKAHDREIIRLHEFAKEIYLHDLKLVDYRHYRSAPQVKVRQMILTGLPANLEDENAVEQDPIWKDVDVPYTEYMDKTMRIFGRGSYKKALSRLETVLGTYALDANANFYAGICLYNLSEYEAAIKHFDTCVDGPYSNFDEEAEWMKAQSLEQLGKKSQARKSYEAIVKENGFYANQARTKLSRF